MSAVGRGPHRGRSSPPRLTVVVATTGESTAWYVRSIAGAAEKWASPATSSTSATRRTARRSTAALRRLSDDPAVHGIILQTPLPAGVGFARAATAIAPGKDVDGANPASLGRLAAGLPAFPPATAQAVVVLLEQHEIPVAGREVAVVGRSTVVGKPLAHLLLDRDATVTVCHSRTADLVEPTRRADVLVAAVGWPGLIGSEHVGPDAVVTDVGTNATDDGGLVGDVDPAVEAYAAGLTRRSRTWSELPRAALTAGQIAESAEFFSFGTNDLTQTTWGFSRDDVEAAFFSTYLEMGIFGVSPFETIDVDGVGELVRIGTARGRATRPDLKVGVCGEHGGDPDSVHFFHRVGLDYVSCSPFRIPVARLEAARVVLSGTGASAER